MELFEICNSECVAYEQLSGRTSSPSKQSIGLIAPNLCTHHRRAAWEPLPKYWSSNVCNLPLILTVERRREREKERTERWCWPLHRERGGWSHLSRSRWSDATEKETPPRPGWRTRSELVRSRSFVRSCARYLSRNFVRHREFFRHASRAVLPSPLG